MRGRKPKPPQFNVIDGGFGAARPPTCPAHLNPSGKAEWKRLARELFRKGIIGGGRSLRTCRILPGLWPLG